MESVLHLLVAILSMGTGRGDSTVKGIASSTGTPVSQISSNVFPSEPVCIMSEYVPKGRGWLKVNMSESISKPVEQPKPVALIVVATAGLILKSEPSDARLLHFIFLFSFTRICMASQVDLLAFTRCGGKVSVITAVPSPNDKEYPCSVSEK